MRSLLTLVAGFSALAAGSCSLHAAEESPNEVVLFDYESNSQRFDNADKLSYVPEHATQGKLAGKYTLEGDKTFGTPFGFYGGSNMKGRWGEFDKFIIDIFVEGGTVKASCYIKDAEAKTWETRYNNDFTLAPGKRQLVWNLAGLNRQNNKGTIKLKELEFFSFWFSNADAKQPATVYLDNARLVKGAGNFEVKVLYSFEGNDPGQIVLEDWPPEFNGKSSKSEVEEHATHGKKALKLESRAPAGNIQFWDFEPDWSRYDALAIDIFNPGEHNISVGGWIRAGDKKASYDERHNWERVLKPGFNTVKFSVGGLCLPGKAKTIDISKAVGFNIAINQQTVFLDNVRLLRGSEEVPVPGMQKFDFGPPTSAVMTGFTRVSKADSFEQNKGYGWLPGGEFARDYDIFELLGRHRPFDDLTRDACMPNRATFGVTLPNGEYRAYLLLAPPAIGWAATLKHRSVTAEGQLVIDEKYDLEKFKKYEYQFEDYEDFPGEDLWEKYVTVLFKPYLFDVTVTDGQLDLAFDSHGQWGWSNVVSGLVLWPKAQDAAAQKWLANLDAARKEQYQALHVEKLPEPPAGFKTSAEDLARGYVRFVTSPDQDVAVNATPTPEQAARSTIELSAAPGEDENGCFGIFPLKDCGQMKLSVSDLTGPGTIPARDVQLCVTRLKALNKTAVYQVQPRYLDPLGAEGLHIRPKITRWFWVTVHVPQDAKPGRYLGQIALTLANGKTDNLGIAVNVWPLTLVEPAFPMGMFMVSPNQGNLEFDATGEARWQAWKDVLQDLRAHGNTSVDPCLSMQLKSFKDGKAEVDFSEMDRWMELAKAAGFKEEISGYAINYGLKIKIGDWEMESEAKRWGAPSYSAVAKAYFDAVRQRAKEKSWLPIAICTDDEFLVHGGKVQKLVALHRTLQEAAPDFRFFTVDSALYGKLTQEQIAEREKMLADIHTWGAGIHTIKEAELIKNAGRQLWLYNTGMNRFTFGAYMFFARKKYDVRGFFQWIYPPVGTASKYYIASYVESHYGIVFPSSKGPRSTPTWERVRAGCDDHKYLETAWTLIQKAKAAGQGAAAKDLEDLIENTISKFAFGKPNADALAGEGRAENPMDPANQQKFRQALAEGILKLQQQK